MLNEEQLHNKKKNYNHHYYYNTQVPIEHNHNNHNETHITSHVKVITLYIIYYTSHTR